MVVARRVFELFLLISLIGCDSKESGEITLSEDQIDESTNVSSSVIKMIGFTSLEESWDDFILITANESRVIEETDLIRSEIGMDDSNSWRFDSDYINLFDYDFDISTYGRLKITDGTSHTYSTDVGHIALSTGNTDEKAVYLYYKQGDYFLHIHDFLSQSDTIFQVGDNTMLGVEQKIANNYLFLKKNPKSSTDSHVFQRINLTDLESQEIIIKPQFGAYIDINGQRIYMYKAPIVNQVEVYDFDFNLQSEFSTGDEVMPLTLSYAYSNENKNTVLLDNIVLDVATGAKIIDGDFFIKYSDDSKIKPRITSVDIYSEQIIFYYWTKTQRRLRYIDFSGRTLDDFTIDFYPDLIIPINNL